MPSLLYGKRTVTRHWIRDLQIWWVVGGSAPSDFFSDVRTVALKTGNEFYDADPDQKHNQKP